MRDLFENPMLALNRLAYRTTHSLGYDRGRRERSTKPDPLSLPIALLSPPFCSSDRQEFQYSRYE